LFFNVFTSISTHVFFFKRVDEVSVTVDEYPALTADDYDPPLYSDYTDDDEVENVTAAKKKHTVESNAFERQSAINLAAFSEVKSYVSVVKKKNEFGEFMLVLCED
jgi:hypothetical protein